MCILLSIECQFFGQLFVVYTQQCTDYCISRHYPTLESVAIPYPDRLTASRSRLAIMGINSNMANGRFMASLVLMSEFLPFGCPVIKDPA